MDIKESVFVAEGARIVGDDISIGENSSVWFNAVIRCSKGESITIGSETNIQDNAVLHTAPGYSLSIGSGVTIGHSSIVHACTVGDNTLIGMGSTVMNGAVVGENCIIGAGSLVTEGKEIPDGMMAFGRPAKVVRELTPEEIEKNRSSAAGYAAEAKTFTEDK